MSNVVSLPRSLGLRPRRWATRQAPPRAATSLSGPLAGRLAAPLLDVVDDLAALVDHQARLLDAFPPSQRKAAIEPIIARAKAAIANLQRDLSSASGTRRTC